VRKQYAKVRRMNAVNSVRFYPPFIAASPCLSAAPSWAVPSLPEERLVWLEPDVAPALQAAESQAWLRVSAPPCLQPARVLLVGDERPVLMVERAAPELLASRAQALRRVGQV
jgi:hypothetical protein